MQESVHLIPFYIDRNTRLTTKIQDNNINVIWRGKEYSRIKFDCPVFYKNIRINCFLWYNPSDKDETDFNTKIESLIKKGLGFPQSMNELQLNLIKK